MIKRESIDELISTLEVTDVIGKYVDLKQQGAVFKGKCPFHNEKSASFTVSKPKQIFKCFGCGVGGDAVSFVMKQEGIAFIEAVRNLARRYNFTLEEVDDTPEERDKRDKRTAMFEINADAAKRYQARLLNIGGDGVIPTEIKGQNWAIDHLIDDRQYTMDTILSFGLGFAPKEWKFLLQRILQQNQYPLAEELGLVKANEEGKTYDVFRDRLIFPIHNDHGQVVGFGGRKDPNDSDPENAKYINSKDSELYRKEAVLYGLYQARTHIRVMGFAILVEGYTDVISMHQGGAPNTVGTCGTALTKQHAKLIKRYTNSVVIMGDGDKAGRNANLKAIDILLEEGLKVDICPLPDSEDPDTFARKHFSKSEVK